jgi:hypothetical protein
VEANNLQQRYAFKFYVELEKGNTGAYKKILKAFGNDSCAQVFRWYEDFLIGEKCQKLNWGLETLPLWEQTQVLTV